MVNTMNTTRNHHLYRAGIGFILAAWTATLAYIAHVTGYFMPVIIAGAMGSAPFILLAVAILFLAAHTLTTED